MQNKIFSQYLCKGIPKGFQFEFNFYEPLQDTRSTYDFDVNLFPEIKTHKNNVPMYQLPSDNNKDQKHFHNKSLHLIGKRKELDFCKKIINETWKTNNSVSILIRGVFGSGKSLFCRKLLHEFFDQNKDLKQKLIQNSFDMPFVLITYQVPTMSFNPFNGWQSILREIYNVINNDLIKKKEGKSPYEISIGSEKLSINCDLFGKLILKSENYSNIRYLEEILGINLSNHIDEPNDENFIKFFKISQIKETDLFFFPRIFNKNEHTISKFFLKMIKRYRQLLDENCQEESNKYPLIFVIEDCHLIDEISVEFITLVETKIKNVIILCTYQDLICSIIQNPFDKFAKSLDFFGERVVSMENINDLHECEELIKNNLEGRLNIEKIDPELINIIIPKTFQGNPLFILDIIDSLIVFIILNKDSNKYVQHPGQELLTTSELIDMDNEQDWISFNVPIRMEKLIGHIIDSLECKEIILLKYAATIGNIFDLDKLSKLNPFNNCTFDDLYSILQRFEVQGLIEILYDLEPKKMVCKFAIPFCREILYQRMLIEQRNDIHMNIARQMQYSKFSYMTSKREVDLLKSHLKKTEKSIINYMEEDDNEPSHRDETKFSTTTNQKIVLVKEICQKLKIIDLKLEEDEQVNKGIPLILEGILSKQSDANITWENRYIVITNKRFYYYYTDKDYKENKEPLGYFEMKNLYNLQILADYQYGSKKNIFTITVSQWQKKDQVKPGRSYKLSADSKEKLNDWVTTLNFLRVKATYDEFACQFGLINLPLPHEVLDKNKKNIKKKFVPTNSNHQKMAKTSNNYYNSIARKSIISSKTTQNSDKMRNSNFGRHSSMVNLTEHINEDQDNLMKTTKVKENISNVFSLGIVCFLGFIQDIVFNLEKFGNSDDKTIVIPKNLKEFRDITPELLTKENREERSTSRTKLPTRIKEENEEEESFSNKELEVINPERSLDRKNEMPPEAQYISKLKNKDIDEKMNNEDKINLDIKEEMNNDGNNKTKKQSYLNTEKLNPNIKIKPINILNANEIVNKVLKSNDDNHISNKLKNFDIMIDEDDIYFENNQNLNSNNIENDNSKKSNNKKEEKSSYMESDKYKDVKIPQKYNNYSSNVFKNKLKK